MISLFGKNEPEPTLLERLKQSVSKTKAALSETVDTIFLGDRKIDPSILKELETALLSADLGVKPTREILDARREKMDRNALSVAAAKARSADVVIVDTAGRLHTKSNLMAELEKMKRTAAKVIPGAPHDVLLVLDATTGQNGLAQAREFTSTVGVTGIILTKLDGTAKGGIVVAISRELGLPIRFVGTGEQINDMVPFDAETYANSLFD